MISNRVLYLIAFALVSLGVFIAFMRHEQTGIPFFASENRELWTVEARIDFSAKPSSAVTIKLSLPSDMPESKIYFEQSVSPGYGFNMFEKGEYRQGVWSTRRAKGEQTLYYRAQIVKESASQLPLSQPQQLPQNQEPKSEFIWSALERIVADDILAQAEAKSSSATTFSAELIKILSALHAQEDSSLLFERSSYIEVLDKLLSDAGIRHRVSLALRLENARRNQSLTPVVEVYENEQWVLFDPKNALEQGGEKFLLWTRGSSSLIEAEGAYNARVSFSMMQQNMPALELARAHMGESGFEIFSVHRLPIEAQSLFAMLLLLPIGALITVFLRVIVGVKTSGTFMPVLIAMAFLQTSFFLGMLSFILLVTIGLMLRSYLSALNLLLVARIAVIVVIVIFLVAFITLIGYELGFNTAMSVAFFPIIILAWTIERVSIISEEEGAREVVRQMSGTLLVATLAYVAMNNSYVSHLFFNFAELHLIIIALIILMGRYTGYRLLELRRFREFENL